MSHPKIQQIAPGPEGCSVTRYESDEEETSVDTSAVQSTSQKFNRMYDPIGAEDTKGGPKSKRGTFPGKEIPVEVSGNCGEEDDKSILRTQEVKSNPGLQIYDTNLPTGHDKNPVIPRDGNVRTVIDDYCEQVRNNAFTTIAGSSDEAMYMYDVHYEDGEIYALLDLSEDIDFDQTYPPRMMFESLIIPHPIPPPFQPLQLPINQPQEENIQEEQLQHAQQHLQLQQSQYEGQEQLPEEQPQ